MYTSIEFSKKLKEAGFKGESNSVFINGNICCKRQDDLYDQIPIYDILNDLCVKYAKEIFGEKSININWQGSEYKRKACEEIPEVILRMLKTNQEQKYIEDYIWSWCILNKDKK